MELIRYLQRKKMWHKSTLKELSSVIRIAMDELPQTATKGDINEWLNNVEK